MPRDVRSRTGGRIGAGERCLVDVAGLGRLVLALFLLAGGTAWPASDDSPVDIPDPNLHGAVARTLGKETDAPITVAEMGSLRRLDADSLDIADLTGLGHATLLERLRLSHNRVTDIEPLVALTRLSALHLDGNRISDIAPLANLTALRELSMNDNRIADAEPPI